MSTTEERWLDDSYPHAEFRYSPEIQTPVRAAGTAAVLDTVCFVCPNEKSKPSIKVELRDDLRLSSIGRHALVGVEVTIVGEA